MFFQLRLLNKKILFFTIQRRFNVFLKFRPILSKAVKTFAHISFCPFSVCLYFDHFKRELSRRSNFGFKIRLAMTLNKVFHLVAIAHYAFGIWFWNSLTDKEFKFRKYHYGGLFVYLTFLNFVRSAYLEYFSRSF